MYVGSAGIMSYNLGHTFIIEQHETYYSGRTRYRWIQNLNSNPNTYSRHATYHRIYIIAQTLESSQTTEISISVNNITLTMPGSDITVDGVTTQGSDHEIIKFVLILKGTITTAKFRRKS